MKIHLLFAILFFSVSSWGADLYVSISGSDSNTGSSSAPFRTIQKAANVASAGTTVHVAPGTYAENIYSSTSGTSSSRIRFISDQKWGAKIIPPSSGSNTAWDNRGSYVDIVGFEVDGKSQSLWTYGIYSAGSYGLVKDNHIHHIGTAPTCSNHGGAGAGTDYYYYGVNNDFIGNVIHHIGSSTCNYIQGIYMASSGKVMNNILYAVGAVAVHLWHDAANITISNNTVFGSGTAILVGAGEQYHSSAPADNVHVHNNIVYNNERGISEQGSTGTHNTYMNNLVYQNSVYNWSLQNGLTHSGDVSADPQFVNYISTGGGDYHLKSNSPVIDKGTSSYAASADIDGNARPQGSGYDIGAYEYLAPAPSPTPQPAPSPSPAPVPSIQVGSTQVTPGSSLSVTVTGSGTNPQDWVALYVASNPDSSYSYQGQWMYLNGTQTQPSSAIANTTLNFVAPQQEGIYNIRLFSSPDIENKVAVSANITVKAAAADSTAPSASITSPSNGATFQRGTILKIAASASDNVGVTKLEFYVNGNLKCSSAASSSTCNLQLSNRRGISYNLKAKAYDAAGNIGTSPIVTIKTK